MATASALNQQQTVHNVPATNIAAASAPNQPAVLSQVESDFQQYLRQQAESEKLRQKVLNACPRGVEIDPVTGLMTQGLMTQNATGADKGQNQGKVEKGKGKQDDPNLEWIWVFDEPGNYANPSGNWAQVPKGSRKGKGGKKQDAAKGSKGKGSVPQKYHCTAHGKLRLVAHLDDQFKCLPDQQCRGNRWDGWKSSNDWSDWYPTVKRKQTQNHPPR